MNTLRIARWGRILACATALCGWGVHSLSAEGAVPAGTEAKKPAPFLQDILIVDGVRVLTETPAVKGIQAQLQKKMAEFQKELETKDKKFQAEYEKISAEQQTLKPEVLEKKQLDFQRRFAQLRAQTEIRGRQVQTAEQNAMVKVHEAFLKALEIVAQNRGGAVIYHRAVFAWHKSGSPVVDVTPEVLTEFNKILPKVDVKIPTEKEVAPPQGPTPPKAEGVAPIQGAGVPLNLSGSQFPAAAG